MMEEKTKEKGRKSRNESIVYRRNGYDQHGQAEWDLRGGLLGDKSNSVVFDNTKLKRLVPDFTATVRFDQGVRMALKYIKEHPEYQKLDPEFDQWCDKVAAAQEETLRIVKASEK